ncbi:phospholipid transfer protein C2CD2L-like isoform X3 [Acanthaster planci]|uniref:Phospholipid transfer protein C2CD2L-like isoform X3 n=1 Tax=Acanthaster planci TaxID=133434 RepID=A0A8B7ZRD7_ACAPL|nr:phospholipid transfer protein C2CD2L-like isoform X3 [Acanthaster planci]
MSSEQGADTHSDDLGRHVWTHGSEWLNKMAGLTAYFLAALQSGEIDILNVLLIFWFVLAGLVVATVSWYDSMRRTKGQKVAAGGREGGDGAARGSPGRAGRSEASPGLSPGATGDAGAETCRWLNSVVAWMYMHQSQAPGQLLTAWLKALNEQTRKRGSSVQVTFDRLKAGSLPPKFSAIRAEAGPRDLLTVTCQVEATGVAFVIFATQQTASSVKLSTCDVAIEKLIGKLQLQVQCKVQCLSDELLQVNAAFESKPDLSLTVRPQTSSKNDPVDLLLVEEIVRGAIMGAMTCVDLSTKTVPREVLTPTIGPISMSQRSAFHQPPTNANVRNKPMTSTPMGRTLTPADRRLLVKVIKANGLRERDGTSASDPYCVVTIDQPSQKHKTNIIRNTVNPFWDEHFLFELNNYSSELRFEVFDRDRMLRDEFLGEAVICLDSLERNPSSRQIIPLQGRLSESDNIKGSLTVEFVFSLSPEETESEMLKRFVYCPPELSPEPSPKERFLFPGDRGWEADERFLFMEPADQVWMDTSGYKPRQQASPTKRVETQRTVAPDGTIITTVTTTTARPKQIPDRRGLGNEMPTRVLTTSSVLPEPQMATFTAAPPANMVEIPAEQRHSNSSTMTDPEMMMVSGGPHSVAETAIKHLSETSKDDRPRTPTKKSTLIIHGVAQTPTEDFLMTDDPLGPKEGESMKRDASPRGSKRRFFNFKKKDKRQSSIDDTSVNGSEAPGSEARKGSDSRKGGDSRKGSDSRKTRSNTLDVPSSGRSRESSPSRMKKRVFSFLKKDKKDKSRPYSSSTDLQNGAELHPGGESPSPTTPSSTGSGSLSVPSGGRSSSTGDLKTGRATEEQRRLSADARQQGKEKGIGSPV